MPSVAAMTVTMMMHHLPNSNVSATTKTPATSAAAAQASASEFCVVSGNSVTAYKESSSTLCKQFLHESAF
jgi:hypothetical protein